MMMQFPDVFGQKPLAMGTLISAGSYEGHLNSGKIIEHTADEEVHQFEYVFR